MGAGLAASRKSRVAGRESTSLYCDHAVARNLESKSAARLFHAKARRREGCEVECPCEPPSAVRKDGFRFHCEYRIPHQCALKGHFNSMCNTHRIVCEKVPASLKMAENGGKCGLCQH